MKDTSFSSGPAGKLSASLQALRYSSLRRESQSLPAAGERAPLGLLLHNPSRESPRVPHECIEDELARKRLLPLLGLFDRHRRAEVRGGLLAAGRVGMSLRDCGTPPLIPYASPMIWSPTSAD